MSSQSHGKRFEDTLKANRFPGSADHGRSPTTKMDVEGKFDKELGLETSIKASQNCGVVALADARAFWAINDPFRLLVGCWRQVTPTQKEFYEVREFIVHDGMMDWLRGGVPLSDIVAFHEGLGLAAFPKGSHVSARAWAKAEQARLCALGTKLILNPKIDSKSQRRLQCSVAMTTLVEMANLFPRLQPNVPNYLVYMDEVGDMVLPWRMKSTRRTFNTS